ncbi:MAG: S8 family peptidase [bacterium]
MKRLNNDWHFISVRFTLRAVITLFLMHAILWMSVSPSFSQGHPDTAIQELSANPKINVPEAFLRNFVEGESKIRVIVNLHVPSGFKSTQEFKNIQFRQTLQSEVSHVQERVISALDTSNICITNRFSYIFGFSAEVTLQGLQGLVDNPDIASIDEDKILSAHLAQGIPLMNAATARSTYNGSNIAIAICDTGIDYTHERLGNGGFPNSKVIGGYDTGENDPDPMDGHGHGTCCAGIAAGNPGTSGDYIGGVAYNAKLYALKMTYEPSNGTAWSSDMVEAWEWCITHQNDDINNPIMIISTSFGSGRYYHHTDCDSAISAMTAAADNARALGITLFVASGNNGYCNSTSWPGCLSDVISVGAVYDSAFGMCYPCVSSDSCAQKDPATGCITGYYVSDNTSADMVTSYSNTASFLTLFAPSNQTYTTDIVGSGGYSSGNYYSSFGGTSAACPYAAGAAACLQSAAKVITGSYLTPDGVKSQMVDTGNPITDKKVDITIPRVNLGAAIDGLIGVVDLCGSISGTLTSGTTYNVTCDIIIDSGQSLIIESNAIINNLENHSFTVEGELTWQP